MRSSSVSPYDLQDWAKRAGFELTEETLPRSPDISDCSYSGTGS